MPNGLGRGGGFGFRGGMGLGFRGSAPPWPYVGIGRGGRPRHEYFFSGTPAFDNAPFAPQVTPEQELDSLRNQAEAIKGQLEQIEGRMRNSKSEKKS